MPRYLLQATYTTDGVKGLLKDGGTKRRSAIQQMVTGLGGKVETVYFAFGEADVYVFVEASDAVSVAAMSLAVNASGAANVRTIQLLTPEEIDQATKKTVTYRAPGQ